MQTHWGNSLVRVEIFAVGASLTADDVFDINTLRSVLIGESARPVTADKVRAAASTSDVLFARLAHGNRPQIVGMARFYVNTPLDGREGWIEGMVVLPRYQKRGIGTLLLDSIEELAREQKVDGICLASNPTRTEARELYQKRGFTILRDTTLFGKLLLPKVALSVA